MSDVKELYGDIKKEGENVRGKNNKLFGDRKKQDKNVGGKKKLFGYVKKESKKVRGKKKYCRKEEVKKGQSSVVERREAKQVRG